MPGKTQGGIGAHSIPIPPTSSFIAARNCRGNGILSVSRHPQERELTLRFDCDRLTPYFLADPLMQFRAHRSNLHSIGEVFGKQPCFCYSYRFRSRAG